MPKFKQSPPSEGPPAPAAAPKRSLLKVMAEFVAGSSPSSPSRSFISMQTDGESARALHPESHDALPRSVQATSPTSPVPASEKSCGPDPVVVTSINESILDPAISLTLDAIIDAVVVADGMGTIIAFNSAAVKMFGYTQEEMVNRENVKRLMPAQYSDNHDKYMSTYANGGTPKLLGITRVLKAIRRNGEAFPVEISLGEIPKRWIEKSNITTTSMFVATLRDISRRQNEIAWSQSRYSKEFEEMELLGRGGFGAVYRCRNRLDGQMYAIKKVELSCHPEDYQAIITMAIPRDHDAADLPRRLSNATQVSESLADEDIRIIQEVQMFARISHHPNVVRYYTSWVEAQLLDQDEVTAEDSESDESSECNSIQPSISILHKKRSIKRSNQARPPADPNKGRVRRTAAKKEKPQDAVLADAIAQGLTTQDQAPRLSDAQGTAVEIDISLSCQETGVGYRAHPSVPSSQGASPEIASGVESQTTSPTKPDRLAAATVLYIQMQLCSSSSLSKWLASRNKAGAGEIDRVTSMNIFRQIVMGLDHIHRSGFIHRDIKPANIFIETGDRVFIGDFGLAVNSSPRSSSNEELDVFLKSTDANPSSKSTQSDNKTAGVGTTLYASPEQLCGRSYDTMTDIYSLGLVFFELFFVFRDNGDRFHSLTELRHGKCPSSFKAGFPQHMSLLKKLLCEIPSRRPTTTDILAHPLLRDQESSSSRRTSEAVKSTEQRPSDVETCAACQEKDHIITRLKAEIGQLKAQLVHYEATLGIQPPAAQQQEDGSA